MFQRYFKSILNGLESLTLDKSCLSCRMHESPICLTCRNSWRKLHGVTKEYGFDIYFSFAYNEIASKILVQAKENGIVEAKRIFARAIAESVISLLDSKQVGVIDFILVPVPTTTAARRRRGEDFIFELAKDVCRILEIQFEDYRPMVRRILKVNRRIADQAKLSEFERGRNLFEAFQVDERISEQLPIILIDDVITTGSTVREAFRALKERNLTVLGGATACASKRRLPIR